MARGPGLRHAFGGKGGAYVEAEQVDGRTRLAGENLVERRETLADAILGRFHGE